MEVRSLADRSDPVRVCALGEAAWHAAACAGLGAPWLTRDDVAWVPRVPHRFLLGAVTLQPSAEVPETDGIVCDSWGALDLPGRSPEPGDPWMLRDPGRLPVEGPPGVTVVRTDDALLFEDLAFRGASGRAPEVPGELHPRPVDGLVMLLAWCDGRPVGTALAVPHAGGVVVSAVNVLASERRLGIGAALTAAAVAVAPDRPATLVASELGQGVYSRLGFRAVGRSTHWHPA